MCQSAFTKFTAHQFLVDKFTLVPKMIQYCSGMTIDSIASTWKNNPDLKWWTKCHPSIVGSFNWLATCTHLDASSAFFFLTSYFNAPPHQHYKSAIHILKYLYSTCDHGISFHYEPATPCRCSTSFLTTRTKRLTVLPPLLLLPIVPVLQPSVVHVSVANLGISLKIVTLVHLQMYSMPLRGGHQLEVNSLRPNYNNN